MKKSVGRGNLRPTQQGETAGHPLPAASPPPVTNTCRVTRISTRAAKRQRSKHPHTYTPGHARKVAGGESPGCRTITPATPVRATPAVPRTHRSRGSQTASRTDCIPDGARAQIARGEAPALVAIVGHSARPRVAGGEGFVGCPAQCRRRSSVPPHTAAPLAPSPSGCRPAARAAGCGAGWAPAGLPGVDVPPGLPAMRGRPLLAMRGLRPHWPPIGHALRCRARLLLGGRSPQAPRIQCAARPACHRPL